MHTSRLKFIAAEVVAVLLGLTSLAVAQQAAPQPTNRSAVQSRSTQPTRTYRSYSVSPSTTRQSTGAQRRSRLPTWKNAEAKPTGQYHE